MQFKIWNQALSGPRYFRFFWLLILIGNLQASDQVAEELSSTLRRPETDVSDLSKWAVNLKYFGLTYHPGGGSAGDTPYKLQIDDKGYYVLQIGAETDLDYKLYPYFYLRGTVALFKDCAYVWSGHYHLGFRANYTTPQGFSFRIGIGPTIIWRENWYLEPTVEWYRGDGFYGKKRHAKKFQTAFLWYGGNLEIDYSIKKNLALVFSVIPGFPQVVTSSIGLRKSF